MQLKPNNLFRTALVLLIAALTSGIMVSTAVSAHARPLFAQSELIA